MLMKMVVRIAEDFSRGDKTAREWEDRFDGGFGPLDHRGSLTGSYTEHYKGKPWHRIEEAR
jgi:hypothetical protein